MVDPALNKVAEDMIDAYGDRASMPMPGMESIIETVLDDRGLSFDKESVDTVLRQIDWLLSE